MKVAIYCRVSTEEQKEAGNSLPAQIERIRKYCERKGFEVEEKDIEEGGDLEGFLEDDAGEVVDEELSDFSDNDNYNPNEEDEFDGMPEGFAGLDGSEE